MNTPDLPPERVDTWLTEQFQRARAQVGQEAPPAGPAQCLAAVRAAAAPDAATPASLLGVWVMAGATLVLVAVIWWSGLFRIHPTTADSRDISAPSGVPDHRYAPRPLLAAPTRSPLPSELAGAGLDRATGLGQSRGLSTPLADDPTVGSNTGRYRRGTGTTTIVTVGTRPGDGRTRPPTTQVARGPESVASSRHRGGTATTPPGTPTPSTPTDDPGTPAPTGSVAILAGALAGVDDVIQLEASGLAGGQAFTLYARLSGIEAPVAVGSATSDADGRLVLAVPITLVNMATSASQPAGRLLDPDEIELFILQDAAGQTVLQTSPAIP